MMTKRARIFPSFLVSAVVWMAAGAADSRAELGPPLDITRIYWEYNASAEDLGVHVSLDGEDWKSLRIVNPKQTTIFEVAGSGPYEKFGMTELFFEGAEPSLEDVPLEKLLKKFPEGDYKFVGVYVDDTKAKGKGTLSHAIPDGPTNLLPTGPVNPNDPLVIRWTAVTAPPDGFPDKPIDIIGYQVIVENPTPPTPSTPKVTFQLIVPGLTTSVTVPPEFVASLPTDEEIPYEVLAIEASGNQTLSEGSFTLTP